MGKIHQWFTTLHQSLTKLYYRNRGQCAERLAIIYLKRQGLSLLQHNFRSPQGEIDLIMVHNHTLVFIEVRLRIDKSAKESVTLAKQRRIIKTAQQFLARHPAYRIWPIRFDVIAMTECSIDAIEWLPHAFEANVS